MKLLQITEEIEKSLIVIFDLALKSEGMSILTHIDSVRQAVQTIPVSAAPREPSVTPPVGD